eukprot:sb/3473356/
MMKCMSNYLSPFEASDLCYCLGHRIVTPDATQYRCNSAHCSVSIQQQGVFHEHFVRTAEKVVTWGITQLKCRITRLGPELGPKVGTGPNSLKAVLTLAVRESHIANFGPNYAGTGPNFGPKCFVKDPLEITRHCWGHVSLACIEPSLDFKRT